MAARTREGGDIMTSIDDDRLIQIAVELGAFKAAALAVADIRFRPEFRADCEANRCGNYGQSWTCPPDAGDIHELIERAKAYERVLIFQSVCQLEDVFDYNSIMDLGKTHNALALKLSESLTGRPHLVLGAGKCPVCERCARLDDEPCRFPDQAICSMESYGINVMDLARKADLKYNNGPLTMTLFGCILLKN